MTSTQELTPENIAKIESAYNAIFAEQVQCGDHAKAILLSALEAIEQSTYDHGYSIVREGHLGRWYLRKFEDA